MKRGQVFVRGQDETGKWGSIDVLDLDDDSFRAWIIDVIRKGGRIYAMRDDSLPLKDKEQLVLKAKPGVRVE